MEDRHKIRLEEVQSKLCQLLDFDDASIYLVEKGVISRENCEEIKVSSSSVGCSRGDRQSQPENADNKESKFHQNSKSAGIFAFVKIVIQRALKLNERRVQRPLVDLPPLSQRRSFSHVLLGMRRRQLHGSGQKTTMCSPPRRSLSRSVPISRRSAAEATLDKLSHQSFAPDCHQITNPRTRLSLTSKPKSLSETRPPIYAQSDSCLRESSKNLQLINCLRRSRSPEAFQVFVQYLSETQNSEALRLVQPTVLQQIWNKLATKSPPIGIKSGQPARSTGYDRCNDAMLSPLKEKHQTTLISSSTNGGSTGSTINSSRQTNCSSEFDLNGSGPIVNSVVATSGCIPFIDDQPAPSGGMSENQRSNFKLKPQNRLPLRINSSQTPQAAIHRPRELTISNLSLDEGLRLRSGGAHAHERIAGGGDDRDHEHQEPVVCWHPYAQPHDAQSRASSPHSCNPSYASSVSSEPDSSSDSLGVDPNRILNPDVTMAIAKDGPNMMKVKKAITYHHNPAEDYKMSAKPRGPCLIVNNIDFEAEMFPTRKGSDEDARRFGDIFDQLGFSVIMRRNQTADQMRALFKEVAAACKVEHDSVFVFILSHGSEQGIYGTDGMEVCLESEIISCFDNRNCKAMMGKPKVFVIQACRGAAKDYGGDGDALDSVAVPHVQDSPTSSIMITPASSQTNRVPDSWLQRFPTDGRKRKVPIRTDMLLIFSCLAGFVSVRNELAGSWLGVALAYFIMTHAHERDLVRILQLVSSDVIQRESSHGHIQSIEIKLLGWTKNLYFNPGFYQ